MRPGPLFSVTGASGSGKSTVCALLRPQLPECVPLDGDALWRDELWGDDGEWHYGAWLRLAAEIGGAGRPVVLCTAAMSERWEQRPERRFFTDVHMLALVCEDHVLAERLGRRELSAATPADFVEESVRFNRWLRANVPALVDTPGGDPDGTATAVAAWVRERL